MALGPGAGAGAGAGRCVAEFDVLLAREEPFRANVVAVGKWPGRGGVSEWWCHQAARVQQNLDNLNNGELHNFLLPTTRNAAHASQQCAFAGDRSIEQCSAESAGNCSKAKRTPYMKTRQLPS